MTDAADLDGLSEAQIRTRLRFLRIQKQTANFESAAQRAATANGRRP